MTPARIGLRATLDHGDGRFADDVALAASLGFDSVRLDVPWAAAQPKAAAVDGDVIERVRAAAEAARDAGLAPWLRLLQADVPRWFDNEGGFTDSRTAGHWWPRWVDVAADAVGDLAAGWLPIEAPFAMANRLVPAEPRRHGELVDTLLVAWRDSWRILRGGPPVATSIDVAVARPVIESREDEENAARVDQLRWGTWLGALREGTISIPGRADRELPDLAGACDILGIATRSDVETALYRAAEQGPARPMALTFRPLGATDGERAGAIETMWRGVRRSAEELQLRSVTITPFADRSPGGDGIVTRDREPKDSAHAFVLGATA